jgi:hypothetical protein
MFDNLSKDIIQNIYEFDSTYREVFDEVLKSIVTTKMKILQKFLSSYPYPDTVTNQMNDAWQIMKKKTIDYDDKYVEIELRNPMKIVFYVMTNEERDEMDNPTEEYNPMIIRSQLYLMNPDTIADFIGCTTETIQMIQQHMNSSEMINNVLYDLLGKEYKYFIKCLQFSGVYDEEVHKYLFKNIPKSYSQAYDNYRTFIHEERKYTIYWHFSSFQIDSYVATN